jgi:hypothetical protein
LTITVNPTDTSLDLVFIILADANLLSVVLLQQFGFTRTSVESLNGRTEIRSSIEQAKVPKNKPSLERS